MIEKAYFPVIIHKKQSECLILKLETIIHRRIQATMALRYSSDQYRYFYARIYTERMDRFDDNLN